MMGRIDELLGALVSKQSDVLICVMRPDLGRTIADLTTAIAERDAVRHEIKALFDDLLDAGEEARDILRRAQGHVARKNFAGTHPAWMECEALDAAIAKARGESKAQERDDD